MEDEDLSPEEQDALEQLGYGYPKPEEKTNILSFFKRIISMPDTSRTANLTNEELGQVRIPVRTNLNLSLYAQQMGLIGLGAHFNKEAQILSATSLSRDGFLDKLAVTQKREMEASTRQSTPAQKKGWFAKKGEGGQN